MTLKEIEVDNFRCFKNLKYELGKITILTGANSSGKSSAIYTLLAALQSSEFPFSLSTNGKYVNMGDFGDISFMHNKSNTIKLTFTFDQTKVVTRWTIEKSSNLPRLQHLEATSEAYKIVVSINETGKGYVEYTYNKDKDTKDPTIQLQSREFQKKIIAALNEFSGTDKKLSKTFSKQEIEFERKLRQDSKSFTARYKLNSLSEINEVVYKKGSHTFSENFNSLNRLFVSLNNKSNYISSFRFNPQKLRNEIAKADLKVGRFGDNHEDQIIYWESKKSPKFKELKEALRKLTILNELKTVRVPGGNFQVKIKTHKRGVYSAITDVGFGISQLLPIIVADTQLGKESTLMVSQPEIHLHPSLQSNFGDYLLGQIEAKKKSYIIETHSEYLLNKIRLLIVEGKLKTEDVKVYYFKNNGNDVISNELKFLKSGKIEGAPQDFFDTYMSDVMQIAMKA